MKQITMDFETYEKELEERDNIIVLVKLLLNSYVSHDEQTFQRARLELNQIFYEQYK